MSQTITIDPVTRIEGHAKITIQVDDAGTVTDAKFHVTQFRGFEKFVEGRPMTEMPAITARICGICPVSHLMASSKTVDDLMAVEIPHTGAELRRLMNYAQFVQSHALSFFHLSSPDFILGLDSNPAKRNVWGLIEANPAMAKDGVFLRKFGQNVIEILGGKRVHPAWTVGGGVNEPLTVEKRDEILRTIPQAMEIIQRTLPWFKKVFDRFNDEIASFANFPTLFLSLVHEDDTLSFYDGFLRITDSEGNIVVDKHNPKRYEEIIAEAVEDHSFLKSPYYKPMGYPEGIYRVGPLARLNNCKTTGTPLADKELLEYRSRLSHPVQSSFHFHYARLIEILHSIEKINEILLNPDILNPRVRARARVNRNEGIGVSEAPRGTLIHHYKVDDSGKMTWANLIVATGHNSLAMNKGVFQVAKKFVNGKKIQEGMLNRVEAVIRCYDPCLSCSTHAYGQMPMDVELADRSGRLLDRVTRD
jgi:NAD-reducing hydrogenase large subunit